MRKWLVAFVVITLAAGNMNGHAEGPQDEETPDEVEVLEKEINESTGKRQELEKELEAVQGNIGETEKKLGTITQQLKDTEYRILVLGNEMTALLKKMEKTKNEMAYTKALLGNKRDDLAESVRFIEQTGELGFLEFIIRSFQSKNLSEALASIEFLDSIARENQQLVVSIEEQERKLTAQQKQLEADESKLKEKQKEQEGQKAIQVAQKAEQDLILGQFKDKENTLILHIQEEENAQKALNEEIQRILQKRIEEEKNLPILKENAQLRYPMKEGSFTISSPFGYRTHPIFGDRRLHNGVDFAAPMGSPIYAMGDGIVLFSGPARGYGNWIVIEHNVKGQRLYTIYGHMESSHLFVKEGASVTSGQHIAGVGNAGTSSGPHLHFCVATSFDGSSFAYVDPMEVIQ